MVYEIREWTGSINTVLVKNIHSLKTAWFLRDEMLKKFPDKVISIFCRGGKYESSTN